MIYIRNLIPSARHPGVVPAERWTGKRRDVSNLLPFGCTYRICQNPGGYKCLEVAASIDQESLSGQLFDGALVIGGLWGSLRSITSLPSLNLVSSV